MDNINGLSKANFRCDLFSLNPWNPNQCVSLAQHAAHPHLRNRVRNWFLEVSALIALSLKGFPLKCQPPKRLGRLFLTTHKLYV